MVNYIAFGIIIDDIIFPDGTQKLGVLGGGGAQTAWGMAAALGSGEQVGLVAGVGDDLTDEILAPLKNANVNLAGLRQTKHPTLRATQSTSPEGIRTHTWQTPLDIFPIQLQRNWEVLPPNYQSAKNFHWGFHLENTDYSFANLLTQEKNRLVSLEPFNLPVEPVSKNNLKKIMESCMIFSPNLAEARAMLGKTDILDLAKTYKSLGAKILTIRAGADGAYVWDLPQNFGIHVPAYPTKVIDDVGAGNAFCGAFLARFENGLLEATYHAITVSSYLIEQIGIPQHLPERQDYEKRFQTVKSQAKRLELA